MKWALDALLRLVREKSECLHILFGRTTTKQERLRCEALLRALKHSLRDRKERGEGSLNAVHDVRQQKLQDHYG